MFTCMHGIQQDLAIFQRPITTTIRLSFKPFSIIGACLRNSSEVVVPKGDRTTTTENYSNLSPSSPVHEPGKI
jgi:hypothetical protein